MDRTPTLDLFVFLLTGIALGLSALAGLVAWRARHSRVCRLAWTVFGALAGLYALALVAVSAGSKTLVLPRGATKHFCGFYLDCHLGVAIDGTRWADRLGEPGHELVPRGRFLVVTLRVSNDARREPLTPYGLRAVVVNAGGRRFRRAREAERQLGDESAAVAGFEETIAPGESYTREIVFDLPANVRDPALLVTEEGWPDTWIEAVLIGDEDSLLHPPTLLGL